MRTDPPPAGLYHPRTLRSMFSATSVRKMAKARFRGLGFIAWARRTPKGVVKSVVPEKSGWTWAYYTPVIALAMEYKLPLRAAWLGLGADPVAAKKPLDWDL